MAVILTLAFVFAIGAMLGWGLEELLKSLVLQGVLWSLSPRVLQGRNLAVLSAASSFPSGG